MIYNIFISHSWSHQANYVGLCNLLDSNPNFLYRNYSVEKDHPLSINTAYFYADLYEKIKKQMYYCNVVLILAGVYSTYSDSIKLEIRAAKALKKPIIAVELWGAERTSQVVKENADLIVGWNSHSIINAISLETYLHQFDY